jgi:hypothetical protein
MVVVEPALPPSVVLAVPPTLVTVELPPMVVVAVVVVEAVVLVVVAPPTPVTADGQVPALQSAPPVQALPQLPQLAASFIRSTQSNPHCC